MLMGTSLSEAYRLEQIELGGETWRASAQTRARRVFRQLARFRREVRGRRPAIVHLNSAPDTQAFLRDAVALRLVPESTARTVFELHGGFERNAVFQRSGPIRAFAVRTLPRASAVVTLNEYHTDLLLRLCPGLTNVRAIPNFLEAGAMSGLLSEPPTAAGDRLRLLFISRVAREKGVFDAVEAARMLHGRGVSVHLTIAGTGDDLDEARALAVQHGLDGVVEFTGFVAGDDKIRAYRTSDVLVFPTYWNEGFPYVLLEAMAAGLPIVSTTHGVMPHLLRDGVNGFLVEPRDPEALAEKIEKLAVDPALRIEIGERNRREVQERYGVEEAARAYGALYDELLGHGERAR
jgi:glycosyltransferase involved in cell wall biosynthesis